MADVSTTIQRSFDARDRRKELDFKKKQQEREWKKYQHELAMKGYEVQEDGSLGGTQFEIDQKERALASQVLDDTKRLSDELLMTRKEMKALQGIVAKAEADGVSVDFLKGEATVRDLSNKFQNNPTLNKIMKDGGVDRFASIDFENDKKLLEDNNFYQKYDTDGNGVLDKAEKEAISNLFLKVWGTDGKEYIKGVEGFVAMTGVLNRITEANYKLITERLGRLNASLNNEDVGAKERELDLDERQTDINAENAKKGTTATGGKTYQVERLEEHRKTDADTFMKAYGVKSIDQAVDKMVETKEVRIKRENLKLLDLPKLDEEKAKGITDKIFLGGKIVNANPLVVANRTGLVDYLKTNVLKYKDGNLPGNETLIAKQTLLNQEIKTNAGAQTSIQEIKRMYKAFGTPSDGLGTFLQHNAIYWENQYAQMRNSIVNSKSPSSMAAVYGEELLQVEGLAQTARAQVVLNDIIQENKSNKRIIKKGTKGVKLNYGAIWNLYKEKTNGRELGEDFPIFIRMANQAEADGLSLGEPLSKVISESSGTTPAPTKEEDKSIEQQLEQAGGS